MEPLIYALNDPKNQGSPAQIHEIQRQLQVLQRDPSAWQAALEFLQHQDAIIRFYGALTLTIKINADWKTDKISKNEEHRKSLLEALVSSYVRLVLLEDENFVLQKLASTLVTLYQKLGAEWPSPARHVLASLIRGQYIPPQDLPSLEDLLPVLGKHRSGRQIAGFLRLLISLAEDINARSPGSTAQQELSHSCGDTLALLNSILTSHCIQFIDPNLTSNDPQIRFSQADSILLSGLALQALPLWIGLLKLHDTLVSAETSIAADAIAVSCTRAALTIAKNDPAANSALQALIMIQTLHPRLISRSDPQFPRSIVVAPTAQQWISALVQGDNLTEGMSFVELIEAIMLQVDVTSSKYVHSGRYAEVMSLLLVLLKCEGVAMIEDQVCHTVLEIITTVVEGHTDWDNDVEAEKSLKHFVQEACVACLSKIRFPPEEMNLSTRSWDKDDLSQFREFRFDVHDFLQSAFGLLGTPLIEAIVSATVQPTADSSWQEFEAGLYCLTAFTDTMSSKPRQYDQLINSVLQGSHFRGVLQLHEVPDEARRTCIRFISEMTAYFKHHPDLMGVLNFLFSSLHLPTASGVASRAIYTLCESQRDTLTDALPGFLASLTTIRDLHGIERQRIYGAVAAIVQSINDDAGKVEPLSQIIQLLLEDNTNISHQEHADDAFVQQNIDLLSTLAAVGRGLRAPDDVPVELDENRNRNAQFWTSGLGAPVQHQILLIYRQIMDRVAHRATHEFTGAACDFLRSGFTESHPSPFKFDSSTSADLVANQIVLNSPNIDAVMGTASSLLASVAQKEFSPQFSKLLHPTLAGMEQLLSADNRVELIRDSTYPSAALDFITRTFARWGQILFALDESQQALSLCIELALLLMSQPDTLPRRAAAHLFGSFAELSRPGKISDSKAQQNLHAVAERYTPRMVAALLRTVAGECARSELEAMSEQIRRYVHSQPMVFKTISREAMEDESAVLASKALQTTTLEQRLRFIAQVDGLRGGRKTNEVIREFWLACRGSEFDYIA